MKKIYGILWLLLLIPVLAGCNDDLFLSGGMSLDGDVPVMFTFEEPSDGLDTRGTEGYKKYFEENDVIHVQGIFTSETGETATAYGAMQLKSRKWVPIPGSTLYWPFDAKSGHFKAFYVFNSDNMLTRGESTPAVNLSDVEDNKDPLEAVSIEMLYGHAVNMQFTHALTYLTLERLEENVSDYFWMVCPGAEPIKNNYQLTLDRTGDLHLEFISKGDPYIGDLAYISRKAEPMIDEAGQPVKGEDGQGYSMVSYYLAPGAYNYFDLRTNSNYPFMSFLNSLKEPLQANHPYTLNVVNAKGASNTFETHVDWDEESSGYKVNVKDFLQAVANGTDYIITTDTGEQEPIIRRVNGILVLQRNVDFDFYKDCGIEQLGFSANVPSATVFDGNLHYIENIGYPVFRFNYGTIQNLGLRNMKAEVTAYEGSAPNDYADDLSNIGGLCQWNRSEGKIQNIRIENFDLKVNIQAEDPRTGKTANENFSIGALCGSNWNSISDIALKGKFDITVQAAGATGTYYSYVDANINIGGIVGSHSYYLSNVSAQAGLKEADNPIFTITNLCRGRDEWGSGVFCIGGAVGLSTGYEISQISIPSLTVNATSSDGYQQYTGGIAGRLRGDNGLVSNCTVEGSLTCGSVSQFTDVNANPYSYMGGIAGNVRKYTVSNCRAVCSVDSRTSPIESGVTYATGGAFGRLQEGAVIISNTAWGSTLLGPAGGYIGNFAGIANTAYDWTTVLAPDGNTCRPLVAEPIGTYLDDTSTE